ncbi:MAG: 50S ribosomal protein L17 [Deltaproteobacteria bacterium]|nr:50S ribosomal protein L17 [Deltaproteobacteria bacterium]
MRHRKAGRKLSRNSSHRKAMLRNIVTSLFRHEQIETTEAKAKELRPVAEKLITLAKRGDLHARRQALAYLEEKSTAHKLFDEMKDRYLDRQGGYLRIVRKGNRKGDGAPITVVQLLPGAEENKKAKKKSKASPKGKAAGAKKGKKDSGEGDKGKDKPKGTEANQEKLTEAKQT